MGKPYEVPEGLTILKALEYVGYRLVRGVGCRAGFCGACATVWRFEGDYRLYSGLACQTTVQDGMYLVILPFTPPKKPRYQIEELRPDLSSILPYFPEIMRCVGCNSCTRVCPQELQVMDAIQAILRNDLKTAAELIFDCIGCGLCSMRCPAEITHMHLFQLIRRLYGKYLMKPSKEAQQRLQEVLNGTFDAEIERLKKAGLEELKELYSKRGK